MVKKYDKHSLLIIITIIIIPPIPFLILLYCRAFAAIIMITMFIL